MARNLSFDTTSAATPEVDRPFVVVRDGSVDAVPRTVPKLEPPGSAELPPAHRGSEKAEESVVFCHHLSFEQALNGILGDLRRLVPVVVVTGAAGTGKTMLVRRAIFSLGKDVIPVVPRDPRCSFDSFLASACERLRLDDVRSEQRVQPADHFQTFWDRLLAQHACGRSLVVFADDAHDLSEALLAKLALLSKWTRSGKQVLQLVLVGLPSVQAVAQRLVGRQLVREDYPLYRLNPLTAEETRSFIGRQLPAFGEDATQLFSPESVDSVIAHSQGIPRLILTLCKLAVFKARLEDRRAITPRLIDQVVQFAAANDHALAAESRANEDSAPASVPTLKPTSVPSQTTDQEESEMTRVENLNKILKNLQNESPGIEASALISEDGLMIASALSPELDDTRVGGMTATLLNLGTRASTELRRGEVKEVIVRGDEGYAVMVSAGRGVLLLVLANENTKLGLIFFDMREAVKKIDKIL